MAHDPSSDRMTIVLVPARGGKSYTLGVRRRVLFLMAGMAALNLLLLPTVLVWSAALARKARQQSAVRNELVRLTQENEKLQLLEARLQELTQHQERVLEWAGLAPETNTNQTPMNAPVLGVPSGPRGATDVSRSGAGVRRRTGAIPPGLAGWRWPVDGWISRGFGGPGGAADTTHAAVDIVAPRDTPVLAAAEGVVSFANWDDELGNLVVVDHPSGVSTVYGHNEEILVRVGAKVKMGQPLARVGSTGRSSAPHLHFEIRRGDQPVDPEAFLNGP